MMARETTLTKAVDAQISLFHVGRVVLSGVKPIGEMTAEEFLDAVEVLLLQLSPEQRYQARKFLYEFDYGLTIEGISFERWYALDELLRLGVKLPEQAAA
jgi:hypothetical protein